MANPNTGNIIDHLWSWVTTYKGHEIVKDTSKIHNIKYDCYINSTVSDPLSFSLFELSDKGELLIDNVERLVESQAAFFLFVNTQSGWIVAVKNTLENVKKLTKGEAIQSMKVRMIL